MLVLGPGLIFASLAVVRDNANTLLVLHASHAHLLLLPAQPMHKRGFSQSGGKNGRPAGPRPRNSGRGRRPCSRGRQARRRRRVCWRDVHIARTWACACTYTCIGISISSSISSSSSSISSSARGGGHRGMRRGVAVVVNIRRDNLSGELEIGQFQLAVATQKEIGGLDVEMKHGGRLRVQESHCPTTILHQLHLQCPGQAHAGRISGAV